MNYTYIDSPLGRLLIAGDASGLRKICFETEDQPSQIPSEWTENPDALADVTRQLEAYFANRLESFDLELAPEGTPFQRRVWKELERIPYGTTISYAELADRIGKPTAVRAVGTANGANPLPIVIPCHRVIGADGSLTGYGGGLEIKEALLALEGALLDLSASS